MYSRMEWTYLCFMDLRRLKNTRTHSGALPIFDRKVVKSSVTMADGCGSRSGGGLSNDFMCEYKVENVVKMNFITENPLDVEIFRNCFKSLSLKREYNTQFIYTLHNTQTHIHT